jgi:hypothetical protein
MATKRNTVSGPKLFGVHAPLMNTETLVHWSGKSWEAQISDRGPTWEAAWNGIVIGMAYANRKAAKNGLENAIRREAKRARNAMGVK